MKTCLLLLSKSRSGSSSRWLARARSDPFRPAFASEGVHGPSSLYVARSAYKLVQLDDKHRFLKPGSTILDLGAAPGGWTQVCLERIKARGKVVAVDLLQLDSRVVAAGQDRGDALKFIKGDVRDPEVQTAIQAACSDRSVDVVLSDMLGNTTGNNTADSANSLELCELVLSIAQQYMRSENEEGTMVVKILQSGEADDWRRTVLQKAFKSVKVVKPTASRAESREQYIVARGLRAA